MQGKTHLIIGATAGLIVAHGTGMDITLGAAVGAVGAWLPDLDHPSRGLFIGLIKHRGVTHSLLATLIVGLLVTLHPLGAALGFGYYSHLLADMATVAGVPLLWPWQRRFHILPGFLLLRTGGMMEMILSILVLMFLAMGWISLMWT